MTYLAAYLLLSLIGCAVWFLITPFLEDDDAEQQLYRESAEINGVCLQSVLRQRAAPDAVEENDAAIGAFYSATARSE
jgi:hypothetical protein